MGSDDSSEQTLTTPPVFVCERTWWPSGGRASVNLLPPPVIVSSAASYPDPLICPSVVPLCDSPRTETLSPPPPPLLIRWRAGSRWLFDKLFQSQEEFIAGCHLLCNQQRRLESESL